MFEPKRQPFDWIFVMMVADIIAIIISDLLTKWICSLFSLYYHELSLNHRIGYAIFIFFMMYWMGLYRWRYFIWFSKSFIKIALALAFALIIFLGIGSLSNTYIPIFHPPRWVFIHYGILVVLLCLERTLVHVFLLDWLKLIPVERIAFIGNSIIMWKVLQDFALGMGKSQEIVGFFENEESEQIHQGPPLREYRSLGHVNDLEEIIQRENISFLLVETRNVSVQQLQEIRETCCRFFINLQVIPIICDLLPTKLELNVVGGAPVYGFGILTINLFFVRICKRVIDLVGGSIGFLISIPVIAVLAILIKRESPGPVFFRQTRLGIYERPFQIIKLRSMRMDAEQKTGAVWAVQDDPRRLKIGAFMRKWNLDELPQFWNVLKGEMGIVGPRPERPEFTKDFKESLIYYNVRLSCKPGITGWAAVHGLRGDTSLKDRLTYDLYYIENWSPWLDIRIILMTFMRHKNAY